MNDVQKRVAEQIGMLVIANAEQAAALEKMHAELQALKAKLPQEPDPAGLPTMGRQE